MSTRGRAKRCLTHHACDCATWKIDRMEQALRVIRTWSTTDVLACRDALAKVADLAERVLEEINDVEEEQLYGGHP